MRDHRVIAAIAKSSVHNKIELVNLDIIIYRLYLDEYIIILLITRRL